MAFWSVWFPFFYFTYPIYILYALIDLDGAKTVLEKAKDRDSSGGLFKYTWDYFFVTHVRFAEIGTWPWAIFLKLYPDTNVNIWDNDHVAALMTFHWLFFWVHVPAGILFGFVPFLVPISLYITWAFPK